MQTEVDGVDSLYSLAWSDGSDLGSEDDGAQEYIVVQRDQAKSTLGIIHGSVASEVESILVLGCELDHTTWCNIWSIAARR